MKQFFPLLLSVLVFSQAGLAQVPEKMTYQAVVRNSSEALVVNSVIGMRISVLQGSATGTAVFVETHAPTSNANGLATVEIGAGNITSGSIGAIDWATGPFFLKTETDPNGGTAYSISGTSQLLSVPYAFYATESGSSIPGPPGPQGMAGVGGCDPNNRDSLIVLFNNSTAWGYSQDPQGVGQWSVRAIGGTNHSAVASKRSVVLYNQSNAYAFSLDNSGAPQWTQRAIGGTNHLAASTDRIVVLFNNSTAYAFHVDGGGQGIWTTQAIGGTNHTAVAHGDKVVLFNNSNGFAFSVDENGNGAWSTQPLGGTTYGVITTR